MFTGLVESTGRVARLEQIGGDVRLHIAASAHFMADVKIGDSISISGVCLTALEPNDQGFFADVSQETLRLTSLGTKAQGASLNLEKSLLPTTRMGGHFVSGHVNAVGSVASITPDARSLRFRFEVPADLLRYIAQKGSITVDGVSLTVNTVDATGFCVNLIPHTLAVTTLGELRIGSRVNVEVDLLARYLLRAQSWDAEQAITASEERG